MENQKFKILLIGIGENNQNLRIPKLCYLFNSIQDNYIFNRGRKLSLSDSKTRMNRAELIKWVEENYILDPWDLIFLIHDYRDDYNWFCTNPVKNICLYSTHGWSDILDGIDVQYSIGSSITQIIQVVEIYGDDEKGTQDYLENLYKNNSSSDLIHFDTIGCLNDFCANKTEQIFKMRTGHVCQDCVEIWEEKLNSSKIDALFEMIEAIRIKTIINKSKIRNRSQCRDLIANIEKAIHEKIKKQLKIKYADNWWVEGINESSRVNIAKTYELNNCVGKKFDYTNLTDLNNIWTKNLSWLSGKKPFKNWMTNKNRINTEFNKLINIRNNLMHNTRKYDPSEDDKQFLEEFEKNIFS